MSIRYIGSKSRLTAEILDLAGMPTRGRFIDAFAGTGAVSREAAIRGWRVLSNDLLPSAAALTQAQLISTFDVSFAELGGYSAALQLLNDSKPLRGFFHREYAPSRRGDGRRYFTPSNAGRIDGMLALLKRWTSAGAISEIERSLILGDLIQATNAVANTAGTYGCYLKEFAPNALRDIEVRERKLLVEKVDAEVQIGNASQITTNIDDVLYLDPPYTKRQYAAYYHVLETLVAGDEPTVLGITGLRPWKDRASDYCYKRRALDTLARVVLKSRASKVLISYSDEGHIDLCDLRDALKGAGRVSVHPLGHIRRYTPNDESRARGELVREVVVEFERGLHPTKQRTHATSRFAPRVGAALEST